MKGNDYRLVVAIEFSIRIGIVYDAAFVGIAEDMIESERGNGYESSRALIARWQMSADPN